MWLVVCVLVTLGVLFVVEFLLILVRGFCCGCCSLWFHVVRCVSCIVGVCLFVACCSLFIASCVLMVVRCLLCVCVLCVLFGVCCCDWFVLFVEFVGVVCCSLFAVRRLSFVVV